MAHIYRCFHMQQHLKRTSQREHGHSSLLMVSPPQSWTHCHLPSVAGAKHLFGARNKESVMSKRSQWWSGAVRCGGICSRALRRNKTRRYKAAHSSTCPNIRGSDNKSSACIKTLLIPRCRENESAQTQNYTAVSPSTEPERHTSKRIKKHKIIYMLFCVGCKSYVSEPL